MSSSLLGKTVAFSGVFAGMTRAQAAARAQAAGAIVMPSLGKTTDILISSGDAKSQAAVRKTGVKVLDASSFMKFVGGGGAARIKAAKEATAKSASASAAPKKAAGRDRKVTTSKQAKLSASAAKTTKVEAVPEAVAVAAVESPAPAAEVVAPTATVTVKDSAKAMEALAKTYGIMVMSPASFSELMGKTGGNVAAMAAATAAPAPVAAASAVEVTATEKVEASPKASASTAVPKKKASAHGRSRKALRKKSASAAAPPTADMPWSKAYEGKGAHWIHLHRGKYTIGGSKKRSSRSSKVMRKSASAGRSRTVTTSKKAKTSEKAMKGKTIAFTGTLKQMKRVEAQAVAQKSGAKVTNCADLSSLSLLVYGADSAAKRQAAKKLGVPLISEAAFFTACKA